MMLQNLPQYLAVSSSRIFALNAVGDDKLITGQTLTFIPLYNFEGVLDTGSNFRVTRAHPDQTATYGSDKDFSWGSFAAPLALSIAGNTANTKYDYIYSDTSYGPLNVSINEDAVFEGEEVIVSSFEALPPYTGFVGEDLLEGGTAIKSLFGKNRKGITFRAFITDDEGLSVRFVGDKPGTAPKVVEGSNTTADLAVIFSCSTSDGAAGATSTCTGIEASDAASEAAAATVTFSQPANAYRVAVETPAASGTPTTSTIAAGTSSFTLKAGAFTGNDSTVTLKVSKPDDSIIEDYPAVTVAGTTTYEGDINFVLSQVAGDQVATLVDSTENVTTRAVKLVDDEVNSTVQFVGDATLSGTKAEESDIFTPQIRITEAGKLTGKAITPMLRIVNSAGTAITDWDTAEHTGLTIPVGAAVSDTAATDAIRISGDDVVVQATGGTRTLKVELLDNTDTADNFARIPVVTSGDPGSSVSFDITDGDSAQASLKVERTDAELEATPTDLSNLVSALDNLANDEGKNFMFRIRLADGDTYGDDGSPNDDGTLKTLDTDIKFTITLEQTGGLTKLLQDDFGTPTIVGASSKAATQAGIGAIAWASGGALVLEGTLEDGVSQMYINLPMRDDSAVEDLENFTATLVLDKGAAAGVQATGNQFPNLSTPPAHAAVTMSIDSDDTATVSMEASPTNLVVKEGVLAPFGSNRHIIAKADSFTANLLKQTNAIDGTKVCLRLAFCLYGYA